MTRRSFVRRRPHRPLLLLIDLRSKHFEASDPYVSRIPFLRRLVTHGISCQLRAGTQTLIQAIQAVPWTDEPEGDDEAIPPMSINSDSSEEEQGAPPLASSIHTIHRPIARSRRQDTPVSPSAQWNKGGPSYFPAIPSSEEEEGPFSEEDDDDFESTPVESRVLQPAGDGIEEIGGKKKTPEKIDPLAHVKRMQMTRSASLATVRLKRRAKLADKLKEVFGLPDLHEVLAGPSRNSSNMRHYSNLLIIRASMLAFAVCP